jgi:UDP-glucose 4-epimerase
MSLRRKFLVTGATTELGRSLCRQLAAAGEVLGVRAPTEPPPDVDQNIACVADLTRNADVRRVIAGVVEDAAIDTVVHLGASVPAEESCETPNAVSTRLLLDAAEQVSCLRAFVLRSTAMIYRLHHGDPMVITERHSLDFSPDLAPARRDQLEADVTACQRMLNADFRISVLRLSPLIADGAPDALNEYLSLDPCYRALGFDPMVNVLSLDDATDALARAADRAPRGIFNVAGADTLPVSELAMRTGARCWPVPGAAIEPLCALRGVPERRYRGFGGLLHHGLVVDGRAATGAFDFVASRRL